MHYTVHEQPSYSIVPSNELWHDPARAAEAQALRKEEQDIGRRSLYFPQVLRDARRIEQYFPGLSPSSPACMDKLALALAHCESKCKNFYDSAEVERVFYPEMEKLLLEFFPGATDALVYNHDVFDKDYKGDRTEDQANKNPGVNANYANIVHNDLNDNSGRVRCRELLTKNLRNFGREQHYTEAQADAKMARRFVSINLAKPMETVGQHPFVLCAWPSFADQPYITNYRIYDDRVGETTRFTYRPGHEWYWIPQQKPTEVSMLKCYDSVTDGSVSRWSFHSACVDPTAPADAPCRKNVVVRSFHLFLNSQKNAAVNCFRSSLRQRSAAGSDFLLVNENLHPAVAAPPNRRAVIGDRLARSIRDDAYLRRIDAFLPNQVSGHPVRPLLSELVVIIFRTDSCRYVRLQ